MKFCMECGTELPERAKFCFNCGFQLTDQARARWDDEPVTDPDEPEPVVVAAPMPDQHEPEDEAEESSSSLWDAPPTATYVPPATSTYMRPETDEPLVRTGEPPVPVAPHAFREPYPPSENALDAPVSYSSALPWETEDDDGVIPLVPPPASAYADEPPPVDDITLPPPPRYDTYVVDDPAPPFADGYDVPNRPPDPLTMVPTPEGPTTEQNWFARHKLVTATTLVLCIVIIAAAVNSNNDTPPAASPTTSVGATARGNAGLVPSAALDPTAAPPGGGLFPGRQNAQEGDQEREIGSTASIDGMEAAVTAAPFTQAIGEGQDEGYIVADVAYVNRAAENRPYNATDWKLQRPDGTVMGAGLTGADGQLSSGELPPEGTALGKLTFAVGTQKGDFYVIWTPAGSTGARGVWKTSVS